MEKTGNPGPIGLLGFGMTTILLNIHNAGFTSLDDHILGMGIFVGGLAQVIAGILENKRGNIFASTAFTTLRLLLDCTCLDGISCAYCRRFSHFPDGLGNILLLHVYRHI